MWWSLFTALHKMGAVLIHYFDLHRNRVARREHANNCKVAVGSASDAIKKNMGLTSAVFREFALENLKKKLLATFLGQHFARSVSP
jgi:hypothetical protein